MKPLGTAILAAAITLAGVLVYDGLRSTPEAPADGTAPPAAAGGGNPAPGLAARGVPSPDLGAELERRLAAQDRRLAGLETSIAALRENLAAFREVWMKAGPRPSPAAGEADVPPGEAGSDFDEPALALVAQQMDEIARRRRLQLRERSVSSLLERLDLGLPSGTQDDLLKTILAFQAESDAFWGRVREQQLDPATQRGAFDGIVEQYRRRVDALVPNEAAAADVARRFLGTGADPGPGRPPMPVPRSSGGR